MRRRADDSGPVSPPVLYVLLALGDRPLHGYAILQEIDARTGGRATLLPTSLYATLKRMLGEGLIEEAPGDSRAGDGTRRRTYRISDRGREVAARELDRMAALLDLGRAKDLAPPTVPGSAAAR